MKTVNNSKNRLTFLLPPEIKEEFFNACEANFTTASQELQRFVHAKLEEYRTHNKFL